MSLASQKYGLSDSEDDGEYVPPAGQESESDSSDAEVNEKGPASTTNEPVDEAEQKRARDALWSSFQASVKQPLALDVQQNQPLKMVKVERKRLFAGKEVVEMVEVPEDSPEAKRWPLWVELREKVATSKISSTASEDVERAASSEVSTTREGKLSVEISSGDALLPSDALSSPAPKPPTKRAGSRKSKVTLAPLPGSTKPKKMTTLEKSALDWKSHLQSESAAGSSLTDELSANRRAGGYLEKVEFLKRVDERKDETLESLKSSKRRKL